MIVRRLLKSARLLLNDVPRTKEAVYCPLRGFRPQRDNWPTVSIAGRPEESEAGNARGGTRCFVATALIVTPRLLTMSHARRVSSVLYIEAKRPHVSCGRSTRKRKDGFLNSRLFINLVSTGVSVDDRFFSFHVS